MISGGGNNTGSSTDLNAELSAPEDFIPFVVEYVVNALMKMRQVPQDVTNDGVSN